MNTIQLGEPSLSSDGALRAGLRWWRMPVVVKKPCLVDAVEGVVIVECGASAATLEPAVAERFGHLLLQHAENARVQQSEGAQGEPDHPPMQDGAAIG